MSLLSQAFVFAALEQERSGIQFPINFDDVWSVIGYNRKDNAVKALKNKLVEGIDWVVSLRKAAETRPSHDYRLSVDSFKMFCLMAETLEGHEVRRYFLDLEKEYVKGLERQFTAKTHKVGDLYVELGRLHSEVTRLKTELKEHQSIRKVVLPRHDFWVSLVEANEVIGYASLLYAVQVLKEEFVEGKDYRINNQSEYEVTEACFHELVLVARPQSGVMVEDLPEVLVVERDRMFRLDDEIANRRFGHSI
jgi:phage anti-repressor protein